MNPLVVGVSYRTAPVSLLERVAVSADAVPGVLRDLLAQKTVGEAVILSTCNRVEIYAGVSAFHAGLLELSTVLAAHAGVGIEELVEHLYVRYDEEAVRHAYRLAAGLDSMVVGEAQILGQLRESYRVATSEDSAGRVLHELLQSALRVGKRVHAETGIDRAGQSVVTAALELGAAESGLEPANANVLVIGAGAMGALACATLQRSGVAQLVVANRTLDKAQRLADSYGGTAIDFAGLPAALRAADIVLCATASSGHVLSATGEAGAAWNLTEPLGAKLILDLAVPRDVDPALGDLADVILLDIERLGSALAGHTSSTDVAAAELIVDDEVSGYTAWLRGAQVAPTVAALRARADDVVAGELRRLDQRRPELTDEVRSEIARTVHRVVQQLLHQPTVRVRQLAAEPGGAQYAALVRELFALDVTSDSVQEALGSTE
ncbi:glutamyl-tRNA reductase [Longispora sp. NPDC051575]|uniref:glutamyl-tRNA reductase n=1 Tax=Longispora sp. NPDC051575 TaxID=3154943 RepID=UPI00343B7CC4